MGAYEYRTLKVDPDVGQLLDRAKDALGLQLRRRVSTSGALDLIIRAWAQSGQLPQLVRDQVLADSGRDCGLVTSHLAHTGRNGDGRWFHCDGKPS